MKKCLILVLALACVLGLLGCDPAMDRLDGEQLRDNTVKIELYAYENDAPRLIRADKMDASVFDFGKATFQAALEEERIEEVAAEIAEQELLLFDRTLNEPIGRTLVLHQSDGTMIVLFGSVYRTKVGLNQYFGYCNRYDENGAFVEYLGDLSHSFVDELADRYFESGT